MGDIEWKPLPTLWPSPAEFADVGELMLLVFTQDGVPIWEGPEYVNGGNRVASQFGRDICRDDDQPENLDTKGLIRLHGLEVLPTVTAQSEIQLLSRD